MSKTCDGPGIRTLLLLVLALAYSPVAHSIPAPQPQDAQQSEAEIVRLEQLWLKALDSGDTQTLETILADDWQENSSLGKIVTRKQFFDSLAANQHRRILGVTTQIEETKVRFYGDVAVATGVVVRALSEISSGKKHEQRTLFTDVFIWRDARWQAVASQETLVPGGTE